jgi:TRAP-type C4-dicarboxylate transport system permease large subunit
MAVPFFILAGEFMNAGGLSKRIVNLASAFFGHLRGGLGYVTIFAALLLASLSGSAVADTAALAAILMPMMRQAGYDPARAGGLMAAGGIIAPVLPPSIGLLLFGVVTVVIPFFIMQQAMGSGFASSKTPHPFLNCLKSLLNNSFFGCGLYLTAKLFQI